MKFRRRPIDRSVIDAVKLDVDYAWRDAEGNVKNMPHAEFEELYQPAHASPKVKKVRKKRGEVAAQ